MNLTREHKILLGVLGAGVLALGVDRFVLSDSATGPQAAAADQYTVTRDDAATPTAAAPASSAPAALTPAAAPTGPSIAETLRLVRDEHTPVFNRQRDAFVITEGWQASAAPSQPGVRTDPLGQRVALFLQNHKLAGVVNKAGKDIAIINDTPCRVGDRIDGAELVGVESKRVTLRIESQTFQLAMESDGP